MLSIDSIDSDERPRVPVRTELVGESPNFLACLGLLAEAAAGQASVLILGEPGTGKEAFARAIHARGAHSAHGMWTADNFVLADCAALPETLVASALFGQAKGPLAGAGREQKGFIQLAHGGTLFLDELSGLPLSEQRSFLRVLQEGRFRPVGGEQEQESRFRLIAASSRDLEALAREGLLRSDLLEHVKGLVIHLPPLRERKGDIRLLAQHCLAGACNRAGLTAKALSPELLEALEAHGWPGNVRELAHAMEKAVLAAGQEPILRLDHLPQELGIQAPRPFAPGSARGSVVQGSDGSGQAWREYKAGVLEQAERDYFGTLYTRTQGNVREMARLSGLTPARVYGILRKHGQGA